MSSINEAICSSKFLTSLKFANIIPVFKQGSRNRKGNYRQICILPIISKMFEKLICGHLSNYFNNTNNILSRFQCGFSKSYSLQHCLFLMIHKCEKAVVNNKVFEVLFTDL